MNAYLAHHGIKGQKWGVRRYQNPDGSYTDSGKIRYAKKAARLYYKSELNKIKWDDSSYNKNRRERFKKAAYRASDKRARFEQGLSKQEIDAARYLVAHSRSSRRKAAVVVGSATLATGSTFCALFNPVGIPLAAIGAATATKGLSMLPYYTNQEAKYKNNR